MKPTLFLSDLHLSADRPVTVAAFEAFCRGPALDAAHVYVLGDLFDFWVGDDQLRDPVARRVTADFAQLHRGGVEVRVMRGNRDLLLGMRFAEAAQATLLSDAEVVPIGGVPTLLLHGDTLCTADADYQRYRTWAHAASTQRRFLALPYVLRRGIVGWMRRRSRKEATTKTPAMMDVAPDAVLQAFRESGVTRMIHGHTHRPARHDVDVDDRGCVRWVLPEWHDDGGYLAVDDEGVHARTVAAG